MTLRLYNTYTNQLEEFSSQEPGIVRMYNCGPTVYSHPHIGNFRSFLFADILRRYLEYKGYQVRQIMNITDVGHLTIDDEDSGEDKMEAAARKENKDPWQIAAFYMNEFFELIDLLNIKRAEAYPRATDHIEEQIALAQQLLDKGHAYEVNGNVYFAISTFKNYGRLSGNTQDKLQAGARIEVNEEKRNPMDFAIWKHDTAHIMQWDSPWGRGFPGWHLECSAMSMKYLGHTLDIHTGGEDNIFPHHECEIAQSECANGVPFSRYWLHARHLLVDGKKMSKSGGNFYTVREVLAKGYLPHVLRYSLMSAHYRQQFNFTFAHLDAVRVSVNRLTDFERRLTDSSQQNEPPTDKMTQTVQTATTAFESAMDHDLNISEALGSLFDFVREVHSLLDQGHTGAQTAREHVLRVDRVLGILPLKNETVETLDDEVEALIQERNTARANRDFQRSDEIRDQLKAQSIILEDTATGTKWKKV